LFAILLCISQQPHRVAQLAIPRSALTRVRKRESGTSRRKSGFFSDILNEPA
jgi:hypothetical protein